MLFKNKDKNMFKAQMLQRQMRAGRCYCFINIYIVIIKKCIYLDTLNLFFSF